VCVVGRTPKVFLKVFYVKLYVNSLVDKFKEISKIYNRGVTAVNSLRVFCPLFTNFLSEEAWSCIQNPLTLLQEDCVYCRPSLPFHDGSLYLGTFCRLWLTLCRTPCIATGHCIG